MKLVQELPEIFEEFGEQRQKAFLEIKEYKDRGTAVVGMYCAYFPTELAMAVGAIPVGLCSFANETVASAERELPKSICPLVKSSYGFALEDKCPFFYFSDLVIGETTCDGKKKMYELMAEFKPVYVMELPNSQSGKSLEFWKKEIIAAKEYFEEFFHVIITEEMIRAAVHLNNRIRKALRDLCEVMKLEPAPVLGADIQKIITGSKYRFDFAHTPEVVDAIREKILEEYRQGKMLKRRPRILVTGCPIGGDSLKVIHEIEKNGGVVVAVENCSGVKTLDQMVDEEQEDIYGAIAKRYLKTGCSIMTPNDSRIELLGRIIDEYHVDGVVEMILTGCHATGAESVYIRKFVNKEKHLPYIAIDTDYSPADVGQIATRLTAFIEMISVERGQEKWDINSCYKIVLSGITNGNSMQEILKEIQEYTRIPIWIYDAEEGVEIRSEENISLKVIKEAYKVERDFPDGTGKVTAVVREEEETAKVSKLTDILAQSYSMKKQAQTGSSENGKGEVRKEEPDFLWMIATEWGVVKDLLVILSEDKEISGKIIKQNDKSIFLSNMKGEKDRNRLIEICKKYMQDKEEKLLIGNGFRDKASREANKELQYRVLKIARDKNPGENLYLTEQYYHELAVMFIRKKMGQSRIYVEELELLKKEDSEKGRDLYETLYWYLRMNRNVADTASKLKVHRNTLLPRLTRINEIIGLDEKDSMECGRLLLAAELEMCDRSGRNIF